MNYIILVAGCVMGILLYVYFVYQVSKDNKTIDKLFNLEDELIYQYKIPTPSNFTTTTITSYPKWNRRIFPRHRRYLKRKLDN